MVELECGNCGREWNYTGKSRVYATCPDCRNAVKIEKKKKCVECGSTDNLQQHHTSYEDDETVTVCRRCHQNIHKNRDHRLYPEDESPGKSIFEAFEDDIFEDLKQVKGDRTWHDAILEEFGVKTHSK
jgi:protein-arginine kinase activator protein McsA